MFGNMLTAVAIPWFVLATTGSTSRTGLVAAIGAVAAFLSTALGSAAVDRFGYRRMSIISDAVSMISVAAIPLLFHTVGLGLLALMALIFSGALLDSAGTNARATMQPELARRAGMSLERVNSVSQGALSLAGLAGPIVGGVLIGWIGASNVLWFNAATFALSILIVLLFVPRVSVATEEAAPPPTSYFADVRAGWSYVFRSPLIRAIAATAAVVSLATGAVFSVLLPVYVFTEIGDPHVLGWLFGAFGAGDLSGVILFGILGQRLPRRATLALGVIIIAGVMGLLALGPPWPVLAVAFAVAGVIGGPINPMLYTVVHERVPVAMMGRVMGAIIASALVAAPVGMALSGVVVGRFGLGNVFAAAGVLTLAVGLWVALNPTFRDIARPADQPQS